LPISIAVEAHRTNCSSHLNLPRRAAAMILPRVRPYMQYEELVAFGNVGLAEAATRYDPTRGASFATFAWYRVQGAIFDGIRRNTNLPRRVWREIVALRAACEYLEHRARCDNNAANDNALAAVKEALSAIRTMYVTSLEALRESRGFEPRSDQPSVGEQIDTERYTHRLREALETLPGRERALLAKHYWEGKNLMEAGQDLGISKSWASRLHAQAVDRLRKHVDG
jgi:RNA polymerase sigma factor FliA